MFISDKNHLRLAKQGLYGEIMDDIKEYEYTFVSAKDRKDYKEILNYVGDVASSLLSINHKYAHKNQNTIRMKPLHPDLELLYFSTSVITKTLRA